MSQKVIDAEFVECAICGLRAEMLSATHFKFKHNMSFSEYREQYPEAPTMTLNKQIARKAAISKSVKGRTAHNKGKAASPEQKRKQSESMKSKYASGAIVHWNLNNTWDDETRAKISESVSAHTYSADELEAIKIKKQETKRRQVEAGWVSPLKGKSLEGEHLIKSRHAIQKASDTKARRDWDAIFVKCRDAGLTILDIDKLDGNRMNLTCTKCNTNFSFQSQIFRNSKNKGYEICPTCYPRMSGSSVGERELYEFIKSISPNAIANDRTTLGTFGKELDVYIPELKLAFEFDGLYYHSDNVHSIARNINEKTTRCTNLGIRLIHVFEDEWKYSRDIVKSRIKQILKVKSDNTIYARKVTITPIDYKTCSDFLDNNHLQGKDNSKIRYGAYNGTELVAVITFKPSNYTKGGDGSIMELNRFAVKRGFHIPGIASKLFTRFVRDYSPERVLSYADRRWSEGNVYKQLGFEYNGQTPPDYWYFLPNEAIRYHRSNFMKHSLVKSGESSAKTEREIMESRGYLRIYDCGSTRWIWHATRS